MIEIAKNPCTSKSSMYQPQFKQLSFTDFILPFAGRLDPENRWVKLSKTIPWFAAEQIYAKYFTAPNGNPALSVRVALGSLIIKETLRLSDEETVAQIQENPYLQFFIGFESFRIEPPFNPSLMTHFRKRFTSLDIAHVDEHLHQQYREQLERQERLQQQKDNHGSGTQDKPAAPGAVRDRDVREVKLLVDEPIAAAQVQEINASVCDKPAQEQVVLQEPLNVEPTCDETTAYQPLLDEPASTRSLLVEQPSHKGQLILDATCAPADIRYPTDLGLLNDAREKTEQIIDQLHAHAPEGQKKPRTYREKARKNFLLVTKLRRKPAKLLRKAICKQLAYLNRNLKSIAALSAVVSLSVLKKKSYGNLLVCNELYRQQLEMYRHRNHTTKDRLVSISQPHVRPIVRGKASAKTEFGMKLSLSVVDGWSRFEKMSWNAYNEGCDLIAEVKRYRDREGYYPESVHVDKIYRTRSNRLWCVKHGIRMSGVPLGRPPKDPEVNAERKRQIRKDEGIRNAVEGKFGQAKRRFGLNRIMAKLAGTSETVVALIIMVMNLQQLLTVHFLRFIERILSLLMVIKGLYGLVRPKILQLVSLVDSIGTEARFGYF